MSRETKHLILETKRPFACLSFAQELRVTHSIMDNMDDWNGYYQ